MNDAEGGGLESSLQQWRTHQSRHLRHVVVIAVFMAAVGYYAYSLRGSFAYAFGSAAAKPQVIGDVASHSPDDLPHNGYVEISGITEHRGLKRMAVRGLSLSRREFWYFRLLGSRGVFIEVPSDSPGYGFVTRVEVSGRAVDPRREPGFDGLLGTYAHMFTPQDAGTLRIVQVGLAPGDDRTEAGIVLGVIALLVSLNLRALWRLFIARRRVIEQKQALIPGDIS